jgi:EAL and modified HD-GYP domain-containing signal transduction protein
MEVCEFVFMDVAQDDLPTLKSKVGLINGPAIIATHIKLLDEFIAFSKLPFQYFQGGFITQREVLATSVIDEGRMKILDLLNLIRQNADNAALIQPFKLSPALSFKLLRNVNAVGASGAVKVNTIEQALMVLGRQNLYRWLSLLLFTSVNDQDNPLDLAIMENALVRARLAELCAKQFLSQQDCDEVFIAGIFSLLDALFKMPIEKILKQVSLPPSVEEVLLHNSGPYAPYLAVAIACEAFDQEKLSVLSEQLNLDIKQINAMQSQALLWALTVNEA